MSQQLRREAVEALKELEVRDVSHVGILAGGGSNENLLVECAYGTVVLRIAEQDVGRFAMDRPRGERAHRAAADAGVAPELIAALPSGHSITRFIEGRLVDAEVIRRPEIRREIGETLQRLHDAADIGDSASAFGDLRTWTQLARDENLELPTDFDRFDACWREIEEVAKEQEISSRLCHNDIQLQNMIEADGRIWLLDFEYAGMGDPFFDLGMLFVNGDLEEAEQDTLLEAYFGKVREEDRSRACLQAFVSALRDATWAVVAASSKDDHGDLFDYGGWSRLHFGRARAFIEDGSYARYLDLV